MQSQRPTLPRRVYLLLHVLVVAAGWGIFGWSWWTVGFGQPFYPAVLATVVVISFVLAPLVTLLWVEHNRDIYARKGQRTGLHTAPEHYREDWAGRLVHAQFGNLRQAQLVIINSTPEDKYFLTPAESIARHEP